MKYHIPTISFTSDTFVAVSLYIQQFAYPRSLLACFKIVWLAVKGTTIVCLNVDKRFQVTTVQILSFHQLSSMVMKFHTCHRNTCTWSKEYSCLEQGKLTLLVSKEHSCRAWGISAQSKDDLAEARNTLAQSKEDPVRNIPAKSRKHWSMLTTIYTTALRARDTLLRVQDAPTQINEHSYSEQW